MQFASLCDKQFLIAMQALNQAIFHHFQVACNSYDPSHTHLHLLNAMNVHILGQGWAKCGLQDHFMWLASIYRNINPNLESSRRPFSLFLFSIALNVSEKKDMCGSKDLFCSSTIFTAENRTSYVLFQSVRPSASKPFQMRPFV